MEQSSDNGGDGTEGQWQSRRLRTTKRSRKGCPQCRRRKIKCDERQLRCGQCQKRNRSCHLQDSVFKQHALSAEVNAAVAAEPIRGEVDDTTFVGHDQSSTRVDVTSPSVGLDSPRASSLPAPLGIEYLHSVRPVDQIPIHHIPESLPLAGAAEHGNVENLHRDNSLLHGGDGPWFPPNIDHQDIGPAVSPVTTTSVSGAASTIASLKDTQEELFLLRHYSEFIAPWMDLLYRYEVFSREVLTLARQHPILRYAACAVAAKQLGQMRSPVSTVLRGKTQESIAAKLIVGRLSFVWYGIKYYEKAIQTLVKSITPKDPQTTQSADNQASPAVSLSRGDLMVRAEGEDPIVRLLGTCILIQYEHLSANRDAWSGHLTGFSKLLDLIDDGKLLQQHPIFEQVYPWTKDIMEVKASFWNFVVNDIEESFLSHRRTRIDTENLALWRNMGLLIEDDGRLALTSGPNSLSTTPEHARDKVLSYTLMRLLCKLIDYLAPSSDWESLLPHEETSAATRGKTAFLHLEDQFDKWFQMLSPSFHPDGSFLTPGDDGVPTSRLFSRELWFSNDLCSTTMMYYHMARMLLLVHRPPDLIPAASPISRDTSFDLLRTFRNVERKLQLHASEVISVVRGTPCDAVKLRAIQPLYVAGRCCVVTTDRKMLLEMLTDIQDSLGIATGYRIQALLEEWGASYQDFGMEARLTAEEQLP